MRTFWLWPLIILISASAAVLFTLIFPDSVLRPIFVLWFLFICPGMLVVRFLNLKNTLMEWTIALAFSFSLDTLLAMLQIYTGLWSPTAVLMCLLGFCCIGTLAYIIVTRTTRSYS